MSHDVSGLSIARQPSAVPAPRRRIGTRVILPLGLLASAVGVVLFAARDALWPAPEVVVEPVVAAPAGGATVAATAVTAPGWIAPDPFAIQVVAMTAGVVSDVLALDGDRVDADQVVARLVPDDALLAVDLASAERDAALAALREVDAERPAIEAALAAAAASIEALRAELELKLPLASERLLSGAEIAQLRGRLGVAEAGAAAARARTPALEARAERSRAELAVAEIALRSAELWLARTEVRAPVAGVVLRRVAAPGTVVGAAGSSASAAVVELYDPGRLMVRVDVPFADAARVGVGQLAVVTVEALPDRSFAGRVVRAVHSADLAKNTVSFHVALDTTDPTLCPDMIARVRLAAAPQAAASASGRPMLFVPRAAVRDGHVVVVTAVDRARARTSRRPVVVGAERDGYVAVDGDLEPGDRVVVDGPMDLADDVRVEIVDRGGRR